MLLKTENFSKKELLWLVKTISFLQELYNDQCILLWIHDKMTWNTIADAMVAVKESIEEEQLEA